MTPDYEYEHELHIRFACAAAAAMDEIETAGSVIHIADRAWDIADAMMLEWAARKNGTITEDTPVERPF